MAVLARLSPIDGRSDPDLTRSLGFLGVDLRAETVVEAAYGALVLGAVIAILPAVAVLAGVGGAGTGGAAATVGPTTATAATAVAAGVALAAFVVHLPGWLANARRARALGDAPGLVVRAVLRMRVAPALEGAATFAARRADGPLAASLDEHVRRARGTPRTGWAGFAAEWDSWNPSLRRAVSLLRAGADAPENDRERILDRAVAAVLDGTRDRMATFAAGVRGPATGIYTVGVVVPLALVAVLPAARAAGMPVSVGPIVVALDLVLPAGLVAAGGWLLGRRPAAFPPVPVPRSHPDVPDRRLHAPAIGLVIGAVAWFLAVGPVVPDWTRWVCPPGAASGTALAVRYRPVVEVRERVRAVEAGTGDALALVGQRLREREAPETAIAAVGESLDGPTGDVFADAARVQRQLRVGVEAAFLGEHGALETVPSARTRAEVALLALAAREGPHGGRLLVEVADHLDDLRAVEDEARRAVAAVTATLRNTALVFAPVVGGATVALGDRLGDAGSGGFGELGGTGPAADPLPVAGLGVAVGGYLLALAVVLTALAVGLERGLDRSLVGYHVGVALCATSVVYPVAVVGAITLL